MTEKEQNLANAHEDALTERLVVDAATALPDADPALRDRILEAVAQTPQEPRTGDDAWYFGAWISTSLGIAAVLALVAGVWLWGQAATETPLPDSVSPEIADSDALDGDPAMPLVVMLDDLFTESTTAADDLVARQYQQEWQAVADDTREAGRVLAGALLGPTDE